MSINTIAHVLLVIIYYLFLVMKLIIVNEINLLTVAVLSIKFLLVITMLIQPLRS